MTSASEPEDPQSKPDSKKRGPKPERLVIDEADAEEALDRLLGKKPKPKPKRDDAD